MIIDIHGHVTAPPELGAFQAGLIASRAGGRGHVNVSDERLEFALHEPTFGGPSHLDRMKQVGTDLQLISPRPFTMMHHEKPEEIVHALARGTNDLIARQVKLHPEVFRGVGGLPQNMGVSPANSVPELERCVKELGFVGCLLNPDPNEGLSPPPPGLGEEYWYPIYEKLVELDVPALIHSASCLSGRENYSVHFIVEETIAIMSLLRSRVFRDFPTLKLIVSHGGGAVPYQIGRWMAGPYRTGGELFEESVRKLYYDTCLYTKESLELLFKVIGPDHCLFGTENPGTGSAAVPGTGRQLDDLKPLIESIDWLGDEDRKKIFEDNAKALYKLDV